MARKHFEASGSSEGLNPNPYFNGYEYLLAKAAQLNSLKFGGKSTWTAAEIEATLAGMNMSAMEHYEQYGCFETDASGRFINPSNAFDANAYWSAKLYDAQKSNPNLTLNDVLAAFKANGYSPVSHYASSGAPEANASGNAFVQTVPVSQRVANDPGRANTGEFVPGNYMGATPAPTDSNARAAQNPADVADLTKASVSPPATHPSSSLPVPGDANYAALPETITASKGTVIIPPSATSGTNVAGNWLVVNTTTGDAVVVGRDGAILGQVGVTVTKNADGSSTVSLPSSSNVPVNDLDDIDPDDLPPSITPDEDLDNNFPGTEPTDPTGPTDPTDPTGPTDPQPDTSGITATVTDDNLVLGGSTHSGGTSSVILAADGKIDVWTGAKNGAAKPATGLAMNKNFDGSGVTGTGTLALDASACTLTGISILGSLTAKNTITASADTKDITGGNVADTIIVKTGGDVKGTINGGTGGDEITVSGKAATINGGDGADKIAVESSGEVTGTINGGAGDDEITVTGKAAAINGDNADGTGDGADTIIIKDGGRVTGDIKGNGGADTITVESGGETTGAIDGGEGADIITISGKAAAVGGGAGNDTITVKTGGVAGAISSGDDNDVIIIEGTAASIDGGNGDDKIALAVGAKVTGNIDGGAGDNTLFVSGAGALDISGNTLTGFKKLDLDKDTGGADKTDAQRLTINSTALAAAATVAADAGDVVVFKNLNTAMAANTAGVNVVGSWYFDEGTKTLSWGTGTGSQTIVFETEGRMAQDVQSGLATWWEGDDVTTVAAAVESGNTKVTGVVSTAGASVTAAVTTGAITVKGSTVDTTGVSLTGNLDATAVTAVNDGVLVLDTSAYVTLSGDVTGSSAARNVIKVSKAGKVTGGGNDDTITVSGEVAGIVGGAGKDTITVETGGSITGTGTIAGGAGADTIVLEKPGLTVLQNTDDSGAFTAPASSEVVATTAFDLVDATNAGASNVKIQVANYGANTAWANDTVSKVDSFATVTAADKAAYLVKGTYADGEFTASATGSDCMLVYDADSTTVVQMEAVVITGLNTAALGNDGIFTLSTAP